MLDVAVTQKLLDFSSIKGLQAQIKVAFVLEGSFVADRQGGWNKTGKEGYTLVKRVTTGPKGYPFHNVSSLVHAMIED